MSLENIENIEATVLETVPEEPPKVRRMRGPGKKEIKITQQPSYYKDYWSANRSMKMMCENCGRSVVKGKMYRHVKSPICARHTKTPEEIQRLKNGNAVLTELD